jgi:hypothetical protein
LEYVTNKINGKALPAVETARTAMESLRKELVPLIAGLTPKDFELFTQLIFTSAGWQRVGVTGGTQKGLDLVLQSPVTGERMMVEVKSSSNRKEFSDYCEDFRRSKKDFTALYYVVHSPDKSLENVKPTKRIRLILAQELAGLAIDAGLMKWLIEKSS